MIRHDIVGVRKEKVILIASVLFIEASMTSHRKRSDKAAAAMDGCVAVAVDILMAPAVDKYVKFHVTRFLSLASMNDIIHLEPNRCRNQVI